MHTDIVPLSVVSRPLKRGVQKVTQSSTTRWFAVYTQARTEDVAAFHLKEQGFRVFLPLRRRVVRHARRTYERKEAFFPRYLFVTLDLEHTQWRCINATRGVSYLLCVQNRPLALPRGLVEALLEATDPAGILRPRVTLEAGQTVRVLSGYLEDRTGHLDGTRTDEVRILVDMMAREVPVYISKDFIISIS